MTSVWGRSFSLERRLGHNFPTVSIPSKKKRSLIVCIHIRCHRRRGHPITSLKSTDTRTTVLTRCIYPTTFTGTVRERDSLGDGYPVSVIHHHISSQNRSIIKPYLPVCPARPPVCQVETVTISAALPTPFGNKWSALGDAWRTAGRDCMKIRIGIINFVGAMNEWKPQPKPFRRESVAALIRCWEANSKREYMGQRPLVGAFVRRELRRRCPYHTRHAPYTPPPARVQNAWPQITIGG